MAGADESKQDHGGQVPEVHRRVQEEGGGPLPRAGRHLRRDRASRGCDAGGVSDWARKERAGDLPAAGNPFQAGEELARLRRENERLRKENEILLKASAFFASRDLRGRRSSSS